MLVLSRKKDQSIMIGDDIEITIVSVEGDQIKLGIDAPRNVDIQRKEIYLAIQAENTDAASVSLGSLKQLTSSYGKAKE